MTTETQDVVWGGITITDWPDPFAKLPALAKRLGVEPNNKRGGGLVLCTKSGETYDVFDLVNAVLDRLEPKP